MMTHPTVPYPLVPPNAAEPLLCSVHRSHPDVAVAGPHWSAVPDLLMPAANIGSGPWETAFTHDPGVEMF